MPRRSTSPMPAVRTLVTGMTALFLADLDYLAGVDDGPLRRFGEESTSRLTIRSSMMMPLRSPTPPRCSAAGHPPRPTTSCRARSRFLARSSTWPRNLGLRHRRRRIRAGAHRYEHFINALRRQAIHENEVHLHAAGSVARRKTLDLFVWRDSVVRGLELADVELLPKIRHHSSAPLIEHAIPRQICNISFPTGRR